jgi:hypothetical protein
MGLFGTSMSTHQILELKGVLRARLFAYFKVVRELGLERRETVRFLSFVYKTFKSISLIRKDREMYFTGKKIILILKLKYVF